MLELQKGIEITERPYLRMAQKLGIDENDVLEIIRKLD
ncbi:MAG: hypothetical protein ACXQS2_03320 [Methermicoccaceae archaeon]